MTFEIERLPQLMADLSVLINGGDSETLSSGKPTASKKIKEEVAVRWEAILAVAQGRQAVETKAALPVPPSQPFMAEVWNDPAPSNNGLYGWTDGAWVKSPYDANRAALDSQFRAGKYWLSPVSTHDYQDILHGSDVVKSIIAMRGVGVDSSKSYFVKTFCNNHGTYKDKITISTGAGSDWTTGDITVQNKASGHVMVTASHVDGSWFELLLDYSLLAGIDGVLVNTLDPYLPISNAAIFEGDLVLKNEENKNRINEIGSSQLKIEAEVLTPFIDRTRLSLTHEKSVAVSESIVGIRLLKGDANKDYAITVFSFNDATYNNNIAISDENGWVASLNSADYMPKLKGITKVTIPSVNNSGVEFELFINYEKISNYSGVLINGNKLWLKLDSLNIAGFIADEVSESTQRITSNLSSVKASKNLKVSLIGSSTTWGKGYLGELSYAGEVEDYLRTQLAETIVPSQIQASGGWQVFANESMCYQSEIGKLSSVGSVVECSFIGDELSLALCKERGNTGASIVELLVDGEVYDTFSTFNHLPQGSDVFSAMGDGASKTFDLGYSFTYGHVVKIDLVDQPGKINQGGYGGTFDAGDEWMVVRKLVDIGAGEYQVRHFLTFKTPPENGQVIECSFDYGESIKPTSSTVGNIGPLIGSGLESPYGEGSTAHDPANPVGLSSGLDFRQNDPRAVKTWRFNESKQRTFMFRIKELDPRATGVVPELFVGFITNRMHYLQNAGIGGYKASSFLETDNLTNLRQVISFEPDSVIIKLSANDDWDAHEFKAWRPISPVSDSLLRSVDSAYYIKSISGSGDEYFIDDSRCVISAVTPFSITFDASTVFGVTSKGDQIVIGDYKGDARRLAVRIVEYWSGNTAFFNKELKASDLIHIRSLSDLIDSTAQVKSINLWETNIKLIMSKLFDSLPGVKIGLSSDGMPNYNMRRLEGYSDSAKLIAGEFNGAQFVDAYGETRRWTYDNTQDTTVYIDQAQGVVSTGAGEYPLFSADGNPLMEWAARNFSVLVDGVERINDGCYISGGQKKGWGPSVVTMTIDNTETVVDPCVLVFTKNLPSPNSVINVRYNKSKWSADDCHPGGIGNALFGKVAKSFLNDKL